ncbi:alpha-L-rhamnosidase C-terminal domain-containing protein [Pedobacter steynii]
MGIEPLSPAFQTIQIKPQPGKLSSARLQLSTLYGKINVAFNKTAAQFQLKTSIPPNTTAVVYLPKQTEKDQLLLNGKSLKATPEGNFWVIKNVKSGPQTWQVKY